MNGLPISRAYIDDLPHEQERKAVVALAKRFNAVVPPGTDNAVLFTAALSFICTHAELSPNRQVVAELMRATAEELLKDRDRFARPTH